MHRGGPCRSAAGEHGAGAEPARVEFTPARGSVLWAGEDEEGLLVAMTGSLVRLRPGESNPRQLASTRFVLHHAFGPRGVVWLDWPGERTEVWWLETGRESPRGIAECICTPEEIAVCDRRRCAPHLPGALAGRPGDLEVKVLGHFVAEGKRHGLAIGRTACTSMAGSSS